MIEGRTLRPNSGSVIADIRAKKKVSLGFAWPTNAITWDTAKLGNKKQSEFDGKDPSGTAAKIDTDSSYCADIGFNIFGSWG